MVYSQQLENAEDFIDAFHVQLVASVEYISVEYT